MRKKKISRIMAVFLAVLLTVAAIAPLSALAHEGSVGIDGISYADTVQELPPLPESIIVTNEQDRLQERDIVTLSSVNLAFLQINPSPRRTAFLPGEDLHIWASASCDEGWWVDYTDYDGGIDWSFTGLVDGDNVYRPQGLWSNEFRIVICPNTTTLRTIAIFAHWTEDSRVFATFNIIVDPNAQAIRIGSPSEYFQSGVASAIIIPITTHNVPNGTHHIAVSFDFGIDSDFLTFAGFTNIDSYGWLWGAMAITNGSGELIVLYDGTSSLRVGAGHNFGIDLFLAPPPSFEWVSDGTSVLIIGERQSMTLGAASTQPQSGTSTVIAFPVTTVNVPNGRHEVFVWLSTAAINFFTPIGFTEFSGDPQWFQFQGEMVITNNSGTLMLLYNGLSQLAGNDHRFDIGLHMMPSGSMLFSTWSSVFIDGAPQIPTSITLRLQEPDRAVRPGEIVQVNADIRDQIGNSFWPTTGEDIVFTAQGLSGNDSFSVPWGDIILLDLDPMITTARDITVTASMINYDLTTDLVVSVDPSALAIRFGEGTVQLGTSSSVSVAINAFNIANGVYNATFRPLSYGIVPTGFDFVGMSSDWPRVYTGSILIINGVGFLTLNYDGMSAWTNFDLSLHISGSLTVRDISSLDITWPIPPVGTPEAPPAGTSRAPLILTSILTRYVWNMFNNDLLLLGGGPIDQNLHVIMQHGNPNAIILIHDAGVSSVVDIASMAGFPAGTMYPTIDANRWEAYVPLSFLSAIFDTYFRVEGDVVILRDWDGSEIRIMEGVPLYWGGRYINPMLWWPRPTQPPIDTPTGWHWDTTHNGHAFYRNGTRVGRGQVRTGETVYFAANMFNDADFVFNNDGILVTGLVSYGGDWHFFDEANGARLASGFYTWWRMAPMQYRFLNPDGTYRQGGYEIIIWEYPAGTQHTGHYLFDANGFLIVDYDFDRGGGYSVHSHGGRWHLMSNQFYNIIMSGFDGWLALPSGNFRYLNGNGTYVTGPATADANGRVTIPSNMLADAWHVSGGAEFLFDAQGYLQFGWVYSGGVRVAYIDPATGARV